MFTELDRCGLKIKKSTSSIKGNSLTGLDRPVVRKSEEQKTQPATDTAMKAFLSPSAYRTRIGF